MRDYVIDIGRSTVTSPTLVKSEVSSPLPMKNAVSCHETPRPTRTDGVPVSKKLRVAIAGNPNAGKSSLFNALTGGRQHVGNWPGKTVERKVGSVAQDGIEIELIDLPGTYSLSAYSAEEIIARDFLIEGKPDAVICVVDASNLERNLYLTVQILELGLPVIVALNMSDQATTRGLHIDTALLSDQLAAPVVATVGSRGLGVDALKHEILAMAKDPSAAEICLCEPGPAGSLHSPSSQKQIRFRLDYGPDIEAAVSHLQSNKLAHQLNGSLSPRWFVAKLLEGDANIQHQVAVLGGSDEFLAEVNREAAHLSQLAGEDADTLIADKRYTWINELVHNVVARPESQVRSLTDRIDNIVTNKLVGIPIFLLAMWATLKFTADVSKPFLNWISFTINGPITHWAQGLLAAIGLGGTWLASLIVDGVIAGVGGVLVFVPVLMALYFVLALLEDSGYMARAAFVMDRLMNALGLHGKSFLPMLVGFGCTVPAFYATRTLENPKDRLLTALLVPFMSCGARLPVYLLFAAIFFSSISGSVVFGMYLLGILIAILIGIALKHTAFRGKQTSAFVMELPPYRVPSLRSIWFHVRENTMSFLQKCSTIIVVMSTLLWFAMAIPVGGGEFAKIDIQRSLFARIAQASAPVFKPLGFGSWEAAGALFTGFVAKEVVISTMAQIYNVQPAEESAPTSFTQDLAEIGGGFVTASVDTVKALPLVVGIDLRDQGAQSQQTDLMQAIRAAFQRISQVQGTGHGALAALAFMVFVLIYTPCMAAISAERQEFGSRIMWASILGQTVLAWLLALLVFQGGLLLGLG